MASYFAHSRGPTFASDSSTRKTSTVNSDVENGCSTMSSDLEKLYAWQYHGYPALSKWMASSNDFFVLRRFSPLQVRCLLYLQDQIASRGKQLDEWDKLARSQEPGKGNSGWISQDPEALPGNPRPQIIRELLTLLKDYNELVSSFSKLKSMQTASEHHYNNVENWFEGHGNNAIDLEEKYYKKNRGDLITMLSKPKYPLIALLHRSRIIRRLFKLSLKGRSDRIDSESTTYTSDSGLDVLAAMLSLTIGLSMTFASIWWLNFVHNVVYRLAIITASGTLMSLIAWAAAGNRPFEILATFAAYMAVLMIYQQIT